jgi:hypothetical protein
VCHHSLAALAAGLVLTTVDTETPPPAPNLYLVVGYDGSGPASRALDAAVSTTTLTVIAGRRRAGPAG